MTSPMVQKGDVVGKAAPLPPADEIGSVVDVAGELGHRGFDFPTLACGLISSAALRARLVTL